MPGARHVGSTTALLIWGSIILVIADDIVYLNLAAGQGGVPDTATIPFVGGYMLLMTVLLALPLLGGRWIVVARPAMLAAVAASLLLLGVFGAFSIGVPLFIAGILTAI